MNPPQPSQTRCGGRERIRACLDLSPRSVILVLGSAAAFLLVVHVALQVIHYQVTEVHWLLKDAFDVDVEENIPTWFSAMLLGFAALLLFVIAKARRAERAEGVGYWKALALGFLFLSLDEVAGIHETLNTIPDELGGDSDFSWTYVGAPLLVVVALVFARFLFRLPRRTWIGMILAGFIYGSGAMGIELFSHFYLNNHDIDTLGYNLLTAQEEGLEMGGVIFFIYVLMAYMKTMAVPKPPES